jgi:hypothetical protein
VSIEEDKKDEDRRGEPSLAPRVPQTLHPLAREILEGFRNREAARDIIIGGGVALQHYLEFRRTVDLDAWWAKWSRPETESLIEEVMQGVALKHGLAFEKRLFSHSQTRSFELQKEGKKVFSFQIAPRDIQLDPPLPSAWSPVQIESFRDNLGAKISALVSRGAPRDFLDIYTVCRRGLATPKECWETWQKKNPGLELSQARVTILEHLLALEGRRPLGSIAHASERAEAEALRKWIKDSLSREVHHGIEPGP